METPLVNRSRHRVTVRHRTDLTQHFRFDQLNVVEANTKRLRASGLEPYVEQHDASWLV
ncbi:MAG TPA: hypothetical protein VGE36_06350 [Roseateles sp.]